MTQPPRAALFLAAAALLAACSVPDPRKMEHLDEIPAAKVPEIDALPEILATKLATVRYEAVADVAGVSCRREAYKGTPPSWEDALRRTKYRAMQAGGNAITNLNCEAPQKNSLTTVCFESIRCTAKAIRLLH
jgi:hypothetical protein